jgi:hypothetical protein
MRGFYESLLQQKMSIGGALRAAKLKTMRDKQWKAPYFWAGFVLQGEYTNHITLEDKWWPDPWRMLLAVLILALSVFIIFRLRRRHSARA